MLASSVFSMIFGLKRFDMRKRFEQQLSLGSIAITDVKFDLKSRDQFPALLMGLQYIFKTPEVNESIFTLLEKKITNGKNATGRYGLTLWEILVLGVVRLNLNLDYARLHDLANNHRNLRGILGVGKECSFGDNYEYCESTIKENGRLIDDETLAEINVIIVKSGHEILKKKRRKKR